MKEPVPLNLLVDKICTDLYTAFRVNGYERIGFTLIACDLNTTDTHAAGNLKPDGVRALLEAVLEQLGLLDKAEEETKQ